MHYTANHGQTAAARELLELGADASLRNEYGRTALEHAQFLRDHAAALETHSFFGAADGTMAAARMHGLADTALQPGTRLRVDSHGDGTYLRWERQRFGPNAHFIRFDRELEAAD